MFTGLVQAVGRVSSAERSPAGVRAVVDAGGLDRVIEVGESISVNGCCLTAAQVEGPTMTVSFDVVPETLAKTALGRLRPGSRVNLEGSVTPATLLGGHLVQGHVDGVGRIASVHRDGEWRVRITAPADLMEFVSPKGSVAVDGVSLTIAELGPAVGGVPAWFEVALIPTTVAKTTLSDLREGDACNLEMDMIGKMVVHWLRCYGVRRAKPDGRG